MNSIDLKKIVRHPQFIFASLILFIIISLPVTNYLDGFFSNGKIEAYKLFFHKKPVTADKLSLVKLDGRTNPDNSKTMTYRDIVKLLKSAREKKAKAVVLLVPGNTKITGVKHRKELVNLLKKNYVPFYISYSLYTDLDGDREVAERYPDNFPVTMVDGAGFLLPPDVRTGKLRSIRPIIKSGGEDKPSAELVTSLLIKDKNPVPANVNEAALNFHGIHIPVILGFNAFYYPSNKADFKNFSFREFTASDKKPEEKNKVIVAGFDEVPGKAVFGFNKAAGTLETSASRIEVLSGGTVIITPPAWFSVLFLLAFASMGIILGMNKDVKKTVSNAYHLILGYTIFNTALFFLGINLPLVPLVVSMLAYAKSVKYIDEYLTLKSSQQFIAPRLLKLIRENTEGNQVGTVIKDTAILFSDIKGYTTLSERYSPSVILDLLNEYLEEVNKIIEDNNGIILNYQGDSIMAIFGIDGCSAREAANRATKTAMMMDRMMQVLRRRWRMEYRELFLIGTGIATGEVALGALGSDVFRQFTAVGDTVNLAARLQGLCKGLRVPLVVDERTYFFVKRNFRGKAVHKPFLIKGKFKECKIYQIDGFRAGYDLTNPGIKANDTREMKLQKKMQYYRDVQESMAEGFETTELPGNN